MESRRSALALRPRGLPEILVACRFLGVDIVNNPQLIWLVDCVLACDYLPVGLRPFDDSKLVHDSYSSAIEE